MPLNRHQRGPFEGLGAGRAPLRIAFLLSGAGRTLASLRASIERGVLRGVAEVVLVISSRRGVFGLEQAGRAGIPALALRPRDYPDACAYGRAIADEVARARADLVVMGGFLSFWEIPDELAGRVMNIHPALIPSFCGKGFWGDAIHKAVLASGAKESGMTIHFADNIYDHGPIIMQRTVPVRADDTPETLGRRVFEEECRAYPEAIKLFAEGRLKIEGDRVRIAAS